MSSYIEVLSEANIGKKEKDRNILYRITRLIDNTEWFSASLFKLYEQTLVPYHFLKQGIEKPVKINYEGVEYQIDHINI